MTDRFSQEDRPRKPIRGVRVRFRTMVRKAGIEGKFKTEFRRKLFSRPTTLCVFTKNPELAKRIEDQFNEFEGFVVRVYLEPAIVKVK